MYTNMQALTLGPIDGGGVGGSSQVDVESSKLVLCLTCGEEIELRTTACPL